MSLVSYLACNLGTFIGAVASDFLPPLLTAALGIAMYAMFIALLMPSLHGNGRLALLVVFTAAITASDTRMGAGRGNARRRGGRRAVRGAAGKGAVP